MLFSRAFKRSLDFVFLSTKNVSEVLSVYPCIVVYTMLVQFLNQFGVRF